MTIDLTGFTASRAAVDSGRIGLGPHVEIKSNASEVIKLAQIAARRPPPLPPRPHQINQRTTSLPFGGLHGISSDLQPELKLRATSVTQRASARLHTNLRIDTGNNLNNQFQDTIVPVGHSPTTTQIVPATPSSLNRSPLDDNTPQSPMSVGRVTPLSESVGFSSVPAFLQNHHSSHVIPAIPPRPSKQIVLEKKEPYEPALEIGSVKPQPQALYKAFNGASREQVITSSAIYVSTVARAIGSGINVATPGLGSAISSPVMVVCDSIVETTRAYYMNRQVNSIEELYEAFLKDRNDETLKALFQNTKQDGNNCEYQVRLDNLFKYALIQRGSKLHRHTAKAFVLPTLFVAAYQTGRALKKFKDGTKGLDRQIYAAQLYELAHPDESLGISPLVTNFALALISLLNQAFQARLNESKRSRGEKMIMEALASAA